MQKIAESLHIGRSIGALAAAAVLASAVAGCKPDSEPEHPYGKVPAKPVVATPDTGPKEPPPEVDAKAGEPDVKAAQADAGTASADAKAPAPDAKAADAGAAAGPDGSGSAAGADLSARFYSLVGLRLVGKGDAGVQRWLFKQNGFFERELHGEDKSVTLWSGTWKLDGDALALTYKETLRGGAEGAAATATEGTARLPVGAVGKLKLSIGGVTVAVDLDE